MIACVLLFFVSFFTLAPDSRGLLRVKIERINEKLR
ncbi:pheST operon leader peptide PheM [Providencia rettgeri]|uniref:PheST operon leader peptide PheM n=1 Tax=Providencia rettgeri TaxID=587 RepID=A0AAP2NW22_PRORE|nr:pheST operon leader peptide PheM [Providencia rettgeri]MBX6954957.1 pheST operon leader peptide PheM [Providencia rettgeri]MBX6958962.1 pheST operon leader peptide PheM [Providencia rettgeri]MBX6967333.1 pheST operon leader peptide PheM [Providencia rettgeri]MBX6971883.1 pheST operon leader peptide PheM [Providencia rettgeri]